MSWPLLVAQLPIPQLQGPQAPVSPLVNVGPCLSTAYLLEPLGHDVVDVRLEQEAHLTAVLGLELEHVRYVLHLEPEEDAGGAGAKLHHVLELNRVQVLLRAEGTGAGADRQRAGNAA